jgi:hypothetical protein
MKSAKSIAGTLVALTLISLVSTFVASCGQSESGGDSGSGSASDIGGIYTSVDTGAATIELRSGTATVSMAGEGDKHGTYTVDGEKIIVDIGGEQTTLVRDGACIDSYNHSLGTMCKGGKSGAAANVFKVPATTGTYAANSANGECTIEFEPGNKFTLSTKPVIGNPETVEATFTVEGDTIYATLRQRYDSMVLKFVNDTYESRCAGLAVTFVKQ